MDKIHQVKQPPAVEFAYSVASKLLVSVTTTPAQLFSRMRFFSAHALKDPIHFVSCYIDERNSRARLFSQPSLPNPPSQRPDPAPRSRLPASVSSDRSPGPLFSVPGFASCSGRNRFFAHRREGAARIHRGKRRHF